MPAGRPPKTNAEHKLQGTYRADRHGDRLDEVIAHGIPAKPPGLDPQGSILWDLIVDALPPAAQCLVDSAMLTGACRWWSLWREYDRQLDAGEGDGYRTLMMATMAWKNFDKAAAKFGMSPIDRARLKVGHIEEEVDPLIAMLQSRRGSNN